MNLATGKRIICSRVVVCKMNEGVVKNIHLVGADHSQIPYHYLRDFLKRHLVVGNTKPLFNYSMVPFNAGNMYVGSSIIHYDIHLVCNWIHYTLEFVITVDSSNCESRVIMYS